MFGSFSFNREPGSLGWIGVSDSALRLQKFQIGSTKSETIFNKQNLNEPNNGSSRHLDYVSVSIRLWSVAEDLLK